MRCSVLFVLPVLLLAACPGPPLGPDLGDSLSGTGEGDDTTDTGSQPVDCASACANRVACGVIEAAELDACTSDCESTIEGYAKVFGEPCAEAQQEARLCYLDQACDADPSSDECEPIGMTAYYSCTETILPELDALCECLAQDVEPSPSDPVTPKEGCVVDTGQMLIAALTGAGEACFDAYLPAFDCQADACADPACASDPAPESCSCAAIEQDVMAACQ
jgi:hypothetical protein